MCSPAISTDTGTGGSAANVSLPITAARSDRIDRAPGGRLGEIGQHLPDNSNFIRSVPITDKSFAGLMATVEVDHDFLVAVGRVQPSKRTQRSGRAGEHRRDVGRTVAVAGGDGPVTPVMSVNWMEPCLALTVYLVLVTVVPGLDDHGWRRSVCPAKSLPSSAVAMTGFVGYGAGGDRRGGSVEGKFQVGLDQFLQGAGELALLGFDGLQSVSRWPDWDSWCSRVSTDSDTLRSGTLPT